MMMKRKKKTTKKKKKRLFSHRNKTEYVNRLKFRNTIIIIIYRPHAMKKTKKKTEVLQSQITKQAHN
ncbi:MAG: hypothetical protein JSY10_25025 [Paenibacillus sp.]|nr:hypothetical protein [Paenibacillus sp.]